MITDEMLKYFGYISRVSEVLTLTICRAFSWNKYTKKLELTKGVEYVTYCEATAGLLFSVIIITYRLIKVLWLNSVDVFGMIIAIGYACLMWTGGCMMVLVIQRREELATWLNSTVKLDMKLKRIFPGTYIYGMTTQQKKIRHLEHLLRWLFFIHWPINLGIIAIFFEKFDPFHRFFVEYIGIKPRWNTMFIPIAMVEAWFGYLICYHFATVLAAAILYTTMELWLTSFSNGLGTHYEKPVGVSKETMGQAHLLFYRCQQVLSNRTNGFCASILVTVHHACFMVAHIVGNYAILTRTSDSSFIMRVAPVVVVPLGYWGTYSEISLISNFREASETFIRKCRVHYGTDRYLRRGFKACRPLNIWSGYPFFCIETKAFFSMFVRIIVEMTINLKLSLP
ncbi:unnamed protein product [Orchesella dallaii]|uniref:Odorant receptor n=1 Tax=Orchesella dallaii TaxID=48710 RepID=A0ABP1Q7M7_9HEXA